MTVCWTPASESSRGWVSLDEWAAVVGLLAAVITAMSLWTFSQRIIASASKKKQTKKTKSRNQSCLCVQVFWRHTLKWFIYKSACCCEDPSRILHQNCRPLFFCIVCVISSAHPSQSVLLLLLPSSLCAPQQWYVRLSTSHVVLGAPWELHAASSSLTSQR